MLPTAQMVTIMYIHNSFRINHVNLFVSHIVCVCMCVGELLFLKQVTLAALFTNCSYIHFFKNFARGCVWWFGSFSSFLFYHTHVFSCTVYV